MAEKIDGTTTVREVIQQYPGADAVFARHGLMGCGGPDGPQEPIAFFAQVHQVDPQVLLRELNELAQGKAPAPAWQAPPDIPVYRAFLKASLIIAMTAGTLLGAINLMGMAWRESTTTLWPAFTQVHGQAQVFGWVGLFIMGVAYTVIPRLKGAFLYRPRLAQASFWLVLAGTVLRLAQPWPSLAPLVVLSGVLLLAGVAIYVLVILRTMAASPQPAEPFDSYIRGSLAWFALGALATLALTVAAVWRGWTALPPLWTGPYLEALLWGFVAFMVWGITLRVIPEFMGLRRSHRRLFTALFWGMTLALLVKLAGMIGESPIIVALGSSLLAMGVGVYIWAMNIFRKPQLDMANLGVERTSEKFVRAAYAWLALAATLAAGTALYQAGSGQEPPQAYLSAYRHAFTVGFITTMIFGMAYRIGPVFSGGTLYSRLLANISFVLLTAGNVLRVASQVLAYHYGGVFFPLMGLSGALELGAFGLFGYNLWLTLRVPAKSEIPYTGKEVATVTPEGRITKEWVVADVLDRYPQALDVFLKHGFTPLANPVARQTMAKTVTVEQATQIHPVDLKRLLEELNQAAASA